MISSELMKKRRVFQRFGFDFKDSLSFSLLDWNELYRFAFNAKGFGYLNDDISLFKKWQNLLRDEQQSIVQAIYREGALVAFSVLIPINNEFPFKRMLSYSEMDKHVSLKAECVFFGGFYVNSGFMDEICTGLLYLCIKDEIARRELNAVKNLLIAYANSPEKRSFFSETLKLNSCRLESGKEIFLSFAGYFAEIISSIGNSIIFKESEAN